MGKAYAVIMAGGSGTRFWPLSRRAHPKQLLALGPDAESLLSATVSRIGRSIPRARTFIVTSEELARATAEATPTVPPENILAEPVGRNTAACIGWAATHVKRVDPDGVLAVLPADHHIGDRESFAAVLATCLDHAQGGDMVTIGIRPTRPETGYGYIEMGEPVAGEVHRARRFVEKPSRQRAEQFLSAGNFLWNSGMFFFRADVILKAIAEHLPALSEGLAAIERAALVSSEQERDTVRARYGTLPSVSIDHGVMEKVSGVAVVPASFGWSDLGSWTTAWELTDKDDDANALPDAAIAIDTRGCYVRAPGEKRVALVGVTDLVVVDTEDALLVIPRQRAQDVREVVEILRKRGDKAV